ncbi:MAG: hypothetical protein R2778_09465 [Saprospiraceae bacterium]
MLIRIGGKFLLVRLILRVIVVFVLRKGWQAQSAENQYNPVFSKSCHIHYWKGIFQIGGKGTM